MKKNFVREMNIKKAVKYKKPTIITLSGAPGSGKTIMAKGLSKKLGFYVISSDYVRNYCTQKSDNPELEKSKIQKKVSIINRKRLVKLLFNRVSIIIDVDINTPEGIEKFLLISKVFRYRMLNIKIDSPSDLVNVERIQNRIMDFNSVDSKVIGDNVEYSTSFPEEVYYKIRERKPELIVREKFDFIIKNDDTKEAYEKKINDLALEIKKTLVLKRKNKYKSKNIN